MEKLNYARLPEYPYSQLKGEMSSVFQECKKIFEGDANIHWLHYYNNLDVARGLQAV